MHIPNNTHWVYGINWGSPAYFSLTNMQLMSATKSTDENIKASFFNNFNTYSDFLNTAILSINTPNITSHPIEEWIGGRWVYTNGRQELRQVDITFRDTADNILWRNFIYIYDYLGKSYPDDCKWHLTLVSKSDRIHNAGDKTGHQGATIIDTRTALLTNIGPKTLSKDQPDSFITFTVSFKYYIADKTNENIIPSTRSTI